MGLRLAALRAAGAPLLLLLLLLLLVLLLLLLALLLLYLECARYHARLAELFAIKKGETYSTTVSWIRAKVSFALLRGAFLCLKGSRVTEK